MRILLAIFLVLLLVDSGLSCGKKRKKKGQTLLPQQPTEAPPVEPAGCQGTACAGVGDAEPLGEGSDDQGDCASLTCKGGDCGKKWKNNEPPADQLAWNVIHPPQEDADKEKWKALFEGSEPPDGDAVFTFSGAPGTEDQKAQLYSAPIACSQGDITVKVKGWASAGSKLEVCTFPDPASPPANCQPLPAKGSEESVTLPKSDAAQRIVIQAHGFTSEKDAAAIESIDVACDPCASTPPPSETTTAAPGSTTAAGAPPCKEIQCDFESGTCAYQPASSGGNAEKNWGAQGPGRFQNRLTGVPKAAPDGGQKYGACYTKKEGEKSTLETNAPFDSEYFVQYEYYKATEGVVLKGCCDDESKCEASTDPTAKTADYRTWQTASFKCPSGTKKVLFVCENNGGCKGGSGKHRQTRDASGGCEGACGIDNIKLLQGSDPSSASSPCSGSASGRRA